MHQCQFSIYDCIQEGASRNILSCHGKQICTINLTKREILSTTVKTKGVPDCSDFNYVQVNFGCISDANDICDSWKDAGSVIHLSHTRSKDKQYDECQCKVRSSLSNGQVLLQAKEMNREVENLNEISSPKATNTDCKKTTYLEIATDRSERKCMDNLPSSGNALFGSGSHNFTLTYVRNDPLSELFFYFELKASPVKIDHHVQIVCNWARRTTTVRTTLPTTRKRKLTTFSMLRDGRLSRLDLIRHPALSEDEINNLQSDEDTNDHIDETSTVIDSEGGEIDEEGNLIIEDTIKSKTKKRKTSTTISIELVSTTTATVLSLVSEDDDEWSRVESPSSSEQLFSLNNQTFINSAQAFITPIEGKPRQKISTNKLIIMVLIIISITIFIFSLYCLKVKQPGLIQRLKLNINVALLFCCEAGKLLFSTSNNSHSMASTPTGTITRHHHRSSPLPIADYQSSAYYMNDTGNNCHTTQSIYEYGGEKSIYSIYSDDNLPEGSEYTTKYDRHYGGDSC
jgi:hypothetical protein